MGSGFGTFFKGSIDKRWREPVTYIFGVLLKPYINYYIYNNNDDFAFYTQFNMRESYTDFTLESTGVSVKSNDLSAHLAIGIRLMTFNNFTLDATGGFGVSYYYSKANREYWELKVTHNKNGILCEGGKGFYPSWHADLKIGKMLNFNKK